MKRAGFILLLWASLLVGAHAQSSQFPVMYRLPDYYAVMQTSSNEFILFKIANNIADRSDLLALSNVVDTLIAGTDVGVTNRGPYVIGNGLNTPLSVTGLTDLAVFQQLTNLLSANAFDTNQFVTFPDLWDGISSAVDSATSLTARVVMFGGGTHIVVNGLLDIEVAFSNAVQAIIDAQ